MAKSKPVGTPPRQQEAAPQPRVGVVTKEIRPLVYSLQVVAGPDGRPAIAAIHPADGEAYVYSLDDETKQAIIAGLTGGLQIAGADELPPAPDAQG